MLAGLSFFPCGDIAISKLECVGHVKKRLGARLRTLKSELKGHKLTDYLPKRDKNRLTQSATDQLKNYYRMAI